MKKMLLILMLLLCIAIPVSLADTGLAKATLINQNPSPARAGDSVVLRFQVENTGDSALKNLQFSIVDEYPFTSLDTQKTQTIDTLNGLQAGDNSVYLQFNVKVDKDASVGTYPLKLKSIDGTGTELIRVYDVDISNQNYAQIIYIDKAQLNPGKETELNFTVNNVGNAPLQNLIFSWNEPTGVILPVYSDDTRYIKYLDPEQSVHLSYRVVADVNANPGLYKLNLNLRYESSDNSTPSIVNSKAGVLIGGQTDFDVVFSQSTQGTTSLSVANTGNNPASAVSVTIPTQANYRVTGSGSSIIGNLNQGDYTLVSFQIASTSAMGNTTNPSAGGNGRSFPSAGQEGNAQNFRNQSFNRSDTNLRVIIQYTDTIGERITVEKSVPIQFRSGTTLASGQISARPSPFIGSTWFWLILIAVIIVGGYFIMKKSSNRDAKKK